MPKYGAIYIAHNPRDGEHVFKVGKTERFVQEWMAELTAATSNIGTYTAEAVFLVWDVDAAEAACHKRLKRYRVQQNREFFELQLSRLVQAVKEETSPFSATSIIPELPSEEPLPSRPKSTLEKIEAANQQRDDAKRKFDEAVANAHLNFEKGFAVINERVKAMREELGHLDHLSWNVPSELENIGPRNWQSLTCSVQFHSKFSGEPPILKVTGLSGGIYGEPDLSRAVDMPRDIKIALITKDKDYEFIEWRELDDGRYGRVEINGRIRKREPDSDEGTAEPVFSVRATSIEYDDYHEGWKEHASDKDYSSPEEALDVFEELIVANASQSVIDVRTVGDQVEKRHGRKFTKIIDRGHSYFNSDTLAE